MEADSDLNEVKNQIDVAEDFAPEENDDNDEINDPKNRVKRLATFRCLFKVGMVQVLLLNPSFTKKEEGGGGGGRAATTGFPSITFEKNKSETPNFGECNFKNNT